MAKHVAVTAEEVVWLKRNYNKVPYAQQARRIGVCVDTLKRILIRQGICEFDSDKFSTAKPHRVATWTRPCMHCGSTKPRPKWKYICSPCKQSLNWDDD